MQHAVSLPLVHNEPLVFSPERVELQAEVDTLLQKLPVQVPCIVNGRENREGPIMRHMVPWEHRRMAFEACGATRDVTMAAIEGALQARAAWAALSLADRCAVFLKAADLLSAKYRYRVIAATVVGQGKNAWQAEIDAAAELCDFWRFNCQYAMQLVTELQPTKEPSPGVWNWIDYRPLEGFVYAITPFNFTAIGGNLASAPALMGNVVLWKPSESAVLSNYLVYQILVEAGLPPGVVQFIPGDAQEITDVVLGHAQLAGIHYTGSTVVFKKLWRQISLNVDTYVSFPRIVGETGGKNFHLVHRSADVRNVICQTVRGAFEFQGQKCSACSRLYVPRTLWPSIREGLLSACQEIVAQQTGTLKDCLGKFFGPVVHERSAKEIARHLRDAKDSEKCKILTGGRVDTSVGWFVEPTVIECHDPHVLMMREEIFGPVLCVYVYEDQGDDDDDEFERVVKTLVTQSQYALTGALFARDREVTVRATAWLRDACGNFYINDKCTGAIVGQQPFGGSRQSGTNDKAGSPLNLLRWTSARSVKELFVPLDAYLYASNQPG